VGAQGRCEDHCKDGCIIALAVAATRTKTQMNVYWQPTTSTVCARQPTTSTVRAWAASLGASPSSSTATITLSWTIATAIIDTATSSATTTTVARFHGTQTQLTAPATADTKPAFRLCASCHRGASGHRTAPATSPTRANATAAAGWDEGRGQGGRGNRAPQRLVQRPHRHHLRQQAHHHHRGEGVLGCTAP